ncbi:MAG: NAD-dependent deacylase [Anaerolineaceae bacterium]|nr:NAD-dependent deacylase [Anaerolineaceae bacterium]
MHAGLLEQAVQKIKNADRVIAFTGAGISVESGIPPFRGESGIWAQHDPGCLDLRTFNAHPEAAWKEIRVIFYDYFSAAKPNAAHYALADMEQMGYLQGVITQNIDYLHQQAGSQDVIEYHGSSHRLVCLSCGERKLVDDGDWDAFPPRCIKCDAILKPDFVFFGESIPARAHRRAMSETLRADVWLVVGTTGEVMPAASLPLEAKKNGKTVIEINIKPSNYTAGVTDIYLEGKATEVLQALVRSLK